MTWSADPRLIAGLLAWTGLAAAAVVVPALAPLASLALLVGVAVLVADAAWLARLPPARIERRWPGRLSEGREATLELALENPADRPLEAEVCEELPRDWVERDPYWGRVRVEPGDRVVLRYPVRPRRRGDRQLGVVAALCRSPLGLLRRRTQAPAMQVEVNPDASRFLRREALDPRGVLAELGVKPARRRGEGLDFESLRDYVPGDDPRRIDWRATARRGKLVTRLHQHERNHHVHIAVDASRLMGSRHAGRSKLDHAVDAALALVFAALAAGDRVSLSVFDRALRAYVQPRRHRSDLGVFVDALRPIEASLAEADYRVWVRDVLARHRKRGLVVVLTDFVEADPSLLVPPLALLARRHRVLLVAIRDVLFRELDADAMGATGAHDADPHGLYRRIVLDDLAREREETLARLRQRGLHTLDLLPAAVTASVLNRYLSLRYTAPE